VNITLHDLFSYVFSENEWTFDLLYCVAFLVMDKQWLERNATYMEFNVRNHAFFCLQNTSLWVICFRLIGQLLMMPKLI